MLDLLWILLTRNEQRRRDCCLFSIDAQFPKLHVVVWIPNLVQKIEYSSSSAQIAPRSFACGEARRIAFFRSGLRGKVRMRPDEIQVVVFASRQGLSA